MDKMTKMTISADTIYFGGPIITMEGDSPKYVEAVAIKNGKIIFVGDKRTALKLQSEETVFKDLQGNVMLPGFIDAHSHAFLQGLNEIAGHLRPSPDDGVDDIPTIISVMKDWVANNSDFIEQTGSIIGWGYDDSLLAEGRHPTADELDEISTETPVLLMHISAHLATVNHKLLKVHEITKNTSDPDGGKIRRKADGKTPNGVLEEGAMIPIAFGLIKSFNSELKDKIGLAAIESYKRSGCTTAHEGASDLKISNTWFSLADRGLVDIDIPIYMLVPDCLDQLRKMNPSKTYLNHVRIAGAKLVLDGSPQGNTAWLSKPYLTPPTGQDTDYTGYNTRSQGDVDAILDETFKNNWQINIHANGDAASDEIIRTVEKTGSKYGNHDRRTVAIHAQVLREDQIDKFQELEIIPSFYSAHTFYWGDWHRDETLGKERAYRISPTGSALKRGMKFTIHHDAPVIPPSITSILHHTVNRISRSGEIIGPDQRISPYFALKAVTDWAAYQIFEDGTKGTICVGKKADLVIIDRDILKIDPLDIINVKVLETIKEGKSIYKRPSKREVI